jgi:hypothetical protein
MWFIGGIVAWSVHGALWGLLVLFLLPILSGVVIGLVGRLAPGHQP